MIKKHRKSINRIFFYPSSQTVDVEILAQEVAKYLHRSYLMVPPARSRVGNDHCDYVYNSTTRNRMNKESSTNYSTKYYGLHWRNVFRLSIAKFVASHMSLQNGEPWYPVLAHRDLNKIGNISQTKFSIQWSLFWKVQFTLNDHWFSNWLGAEQATSHCRSHMSHWRIYALFDLS